MSKVIAGSKYLSELFQHRMFRDSAGIFAAQMAGIILGMLSGVILARSFSLSDMGQFQLILAYMAMGQIAGLPGMNTIILKGAMKKYDPICYPAMKQSVLTSSIAGIVVSSVGGFLYWQNWQRNLGFTLLVVGFFLPLSGVEKFDSVLQGKKEFILSRKIVLFSGVISLLFVGGTAYLTRQLHYVLAASFFTRIVTLSIGWWIVGKKFRKVQRNHAFEEELLRQGWQLTALSVFNLIISRIDKIILGTINPALLAVYHVGTTIPRQIKANSKSLLTVPVCHWGNLSKEENLSRLKRHGMKFFGIGVAITVAIWIVSPWLLPALYGNTYHASVSVAQWFSLSIGLQFFSIMIWSFDLYQNQGKFYRKQQVLRQILYIGLLSVLVPLYLIYGVIGAILIADVLTWGMAIYFFRRENMQSGSEKST